MTILGKKANIWASCYSDLNKFLITATQEKLQEYEGWRGLGLGGV